MENSAVKSAQITDSSKTVYVYDDKLGDWINVNKFLENLKQAIQKLESKNGYRNKKRNRVKERKDFNLIRLYYSSGYKDLEAMLKNRGRAYETDPGTD